MHIEKIRKEKVLPVKFNSGDFREDLKSFLSFQGVDDKDLKDYVDSVYALILGTVKKYHDEDSWDISNIDFAYGNNAEYWHDEYSSLLNAKEFIEKSLLVQNTMISGQFLFEQNSRKELELKYENLYKKCSDLESSIPTDIFWPKYVDGKIVCIGDRVKVEDCEFIVESISFERDFESEEFKIVAKIEGQYCEFYVDGIDINYPDPDTEESILIEALNCNKSDLDDQKCKEVLANLKSRLKKVRNDAASETSN